MPIVTIVLAVLNVGIWGLSVTMGADPISPTPDKIFELGGNFGPATLGGESWRLVASMFLHYGLLHIAMNMIGLVDGGRHVERMYGRAAFAALYLFSGVVGSLVSAIPGTAVSAGASGAVFGIFGAWAAYLLLHRDQIDKEALAKQSRGLLVFLVYNIWFGIAAEGIDMRAHLGGLGAGFVSGLILSTTRPQGWRVIAVFVGSALTIAAAHVVPPPENRVMLESSVERLKEFDRLKKRAFDRLGELLKDQTLEGRTVATAIDSEILPVWREAKEVIERIEYLPKQMGKNLRSFVRAGEDALIAISAAVRNGDPEAITVAVNKLQLAVTTYVEKMKP